MCGFAGLVSADGAAVPTARLEALGAALAHRGPDGRHHYACDDVGMVHARLAIIDLATGDQPLRGPDRTALVANGEIYNYLELREAMAGETWTTRSDCEPPLFLYRDHGLDFVDRLRGMYALALHDPARRRLVLARDPFGIKPLYLAETPHGIAFASEPQALIAAGLVTPRVDPLARDELLQLQFTTGRRTPFVGIERVLPGETVVIEAGRIVERRRRAALPDGGPQSLGEAEALARLDATLTDSVAVHQRSDVPYGLFLSGGIDSSAILALMARLNPRPVRAFTVGFPGTAARDEREHAKAVAAAVGAEHVDVEFTENDFWTLLPRVAAAMDDPAADYAILPTYKLAEAASRELKVVLAGEGGDEIFGGYGRYRRAQRPWWLGGRPMRNRGTFDGLNVLRDPLPNWRKGMAEAQARAAIAGRSRLQIAQATDIADWLPNDLLTKLDRCLMAHGVEGRTPFLDPVVAEAAFRLPDSLKIRQGQGKWLLRRWLAQALPEARALSPKRGFTVPVGEWIARQGRKLGPLVARQPGIAEMVHPGAVEALFAAGESAGRAWKGGFAAWTLLFYALWHQRHLCGRTRLGDVWDSLADTG